MSDRIDDAKAIATDVFGEDDVIRRVDAVEALAGWGSSPLVLMPVPSAQQWIPCSERLPEELAEVNITWINTQPESYYAHIKNKPFVGTGIYYDGAWWWYSCVCQDLLYETGRSGADKMDDAIKVTAWMPLPEPYKGGDIE